MEDDDGLAQPIIDKTTEYCSGFTGKIGVSKNYFCYFCYGVDQRLDIYFQAQALQEMLGCGTHHKYKI